jgi:hypothetical protein
MASFEKKSISGKFFLNFFGEIFNIIYFFDLDAKLCTKEFWLVPRVCQSKIKSPQTSVKPYDGTVPH